MPAKHKALDLGELIPRYFIGAHVILRIGRAMQIGGVFRRNVAARWPTSQNCAPDHRIAIQTNVVLSGTIPVIDGAEQQRPEFTELFSAGSHITTWLDSHGLTPCQGGTISNPRALYSSFRF